MEKPSPFLTGFISILKQVKEKEYFTSVHDFSLNREIILRKYSELLLNKTNGFVVLCNFSTGQYEYVSENIKDNLGYDVHGLTAEELTYLMGSIIHEKHVTLMITTYLSKFCNYIKEHATAATGTDYRTTCCCKLKNVYDVYEWYLLDTSVIQSDETGFPLTTLITCTNINLFKKEESFYYNIQKKNSDGIFEIVFEDTGNNELDEYHLTKREIEVINLISQGYSNKRIADALSISLYTVQTHRKRIVKKVNCKGTAELTNFAFSRGIL